jgi:thymidylate synthase (FAD)
MPTQEPEPATSVVRDPRVYLVGRQTVDDQALAAFLADHGVSHWSTDTTVAGEKLIEVAGRLCYLSFARPRPGGNAAYIGHILEVGHGSVLEHSVYNLIISGVSRSFTHELVRHRAGFGFSQLSQRFVDESSCRFVEPDVIADDPELHAVWLDAVRTSQRAYRALADGLAAKFPDLDDRTLRRKKAREAARSVLPNATETEIFVTANGRALRHFIEMRADPAADVEIRKVAVAVLRLLQAESPNLFGDYTITDLPGGGQTASTTHRKV